MRRNENGVLPEEEGKSIALSASLARVVDGPSRSDTVRSREHETRNGHQNTKQNP